MKITYLTDPGPITMGTGIFMATPHLCESFFLKLPRMPRKEAVGAALLQARSYVPGHPEGLELAVRLFPSDKSWTALVHAVRKDTFPEGNGKISIFAPCDFLEERLERGIFLAVFMTPGWLEWIEFENGAIVDHGLAELHDPIKISVPAPLIDAAARTGGIVLWHPEALSEDALTLAGGFPTLCSLCSYESAVKKSLVSGRNSFGKRNDSRRAILGMIALALGVLNIALVAFATSNIISVARAELDQLKSERARLLTLTSESTRLEAEIKSIELSISGSKGDKDPYMLLSLIAGLMPAGDRITRIDIQGQSFRLEGRSADPYELVSRLDKSDQLTNITLGQALPIAGTNLSKFFLAGVCP